MFVLDCSVAMAWCFQDEASAYADRVLNLLQTQIAVVPRLWHLEVMNVLLVAERRGRLEPARSDTFLSLLGDLDIQTDDRDARVQEKSFLALARSTRLSAYDTTYLHLAQREGLPVATLDGRLREAALGINLFLK